MHALVRLSENPDTSRDLVHIEEDLEDDGVEVEPLECVRRSFRGMVFADDAGIVSKFAEGLAKMMTINVTVFEAEGYTVCEMKEEAKLLRTLHPLLPTSSLVGKAAGLRYIQTVQFLYLAGYINVNADIMPENT